MLCLYIVVNEEKYYICHQNIFFNIVKFVGKNTEHS
jgi:hypothetical protein